MEKNWRDDDRELILRGWLRLEERAIPCTFTYTQIHVPFNLCVCGKVSQENFRVHPVSCLSTFNHSGRHWTLATMGTKTTLLVLESVLLSHTYWNKIKIKAP
ncbi:hypothetical protein L9F63_004349, partial [Diploptera punctata]